MRVSLDHSAVLVLSICAATLTGQATADAEPDGSYSHVIVTVRDSSGTYIQGAKIRVAGALASFDNSRGYYSTKVANAATEQTPQTVDVEASHPDFVDASEQVMIHPKRKAVYVDLRMRRPGEPYYINYGERVPVVEHRDKVLVHLKASRAKAKKSTLSKVAKRLVAQVAKDHGLEVIHHYDALADTSRGGGPAFRWMFVARRKDGKEVPDANSKTLAALRGDRRVRFAGPFVTRSKSLSDPMGLGHSVNVQFDKKLPKKKVLSRLAKHGFSNAAEVGWGSGSYRVELDTHVGWDAVAAAEKIEKIPGVVSVDSALYVLIRLL